MLVEVGYLANRGTGLGLDEEFNPTPVRYLSRSPVRDQATIDYLSQRQDGYNNWDLSLFKNIRLKERLTFQLRCEAQDAFNHAMFAVPNTAPTNTLFGQVSAIVGTEQRRVQVAGKLSW